MVSKFTPINNIKLHLKPISLRAANDWLDGVHRHNGRTTRNGGKFAISVVDVNAEIVGVCIVGNPISASFMDGKTAEVLRVCTRDVGPKNICSMLYAAAWRAWKAMGGDRMLTYTLQTENGASLRASGWVIVGKTRPTEDGWRKKDHLKRAHQPVMLEPKFRWEPGQSRGATEAKITEVRPDARP